MRRVSKTLVTIGACATAGGIQALRNFADVDEFVSTVYATPGVHLDARDLDADLRARAGRLRAARLPDRQGAAARGADRASCTAAARRSPRRSVCLECKRRGNVCVMVAHGTPCLGPVTHAGCGAICPAYNRGCYGCFGPMETPNTVSLTKQLRVLGLGDAGVERVFRTFNVEAFENARANGRGPGRRRSRPTTSPASRARARCSCGSPAARSKR